MLNSPAGTAATMKPEPARAVASVEMLRRLIAFPTVSRDSNLELIEYVRGYLAPYDA